jgi:hypothetical protein
MRGKILAIAAALMLGIATTGGAALARGGGGSGGHGGGGHGGGFGGAHIGGGFGGGHFGGHTMGTAGAHGFAASRGLGHSLVARDFRDHHYRGRYGWWPQYGYNDCAWPYYDYNSCYAYGG